MSLRDQWQKLIRRWKHKNTDDPAKANNEQDSGEYDMPDSFANLNEVAAPEPVQNRDGSARTYVHHTLEEQKR